MIFYTTALLHSRRTSATFSKRFSSPRRRRPTFARWVYTMIKGTATVEVGNLHDKRSYHVELAGATGRANMALRHRSLPNSGPASRVPVAQKAVKP